jgi:hypothetical protein
VAWPTGNWKVRAGTVIALLAVALVVAMLAANGWRPAYD